jgi:DNA polymerase-3 subunit gamma/tau
MSYVVLARKWRPQTFSDLVGQGHVASTLANAIKTGRVAHAFLFTGVRGVGKTTSARILAKALNCMASDGPTSTPCLQCSACKEITDGVDIDVQEIDGASYNGVDEVRRLQESLPYRPNRDRYKIFIVDEVHMLSNSAWNAFLKTLEEPPPHVKFIFATTEVHKVPVTILSRVQRFDFKLISTRLIVGRLRYVLEQEGLSADDAALAVIAREAAGSMRDAMSLLDQVIAWSTEALSEASVSAVLGVASRKILYDLVGELIAGKPAPILQIIDSLSNQGFDMTHVTRDLLAVLRDVAVVATAKGAEELVDLPEDERRAVEKLAQHELDDLLRLHQGFSKGYDEVARSGQPRAALEMLLVRLARRPPLVPIEDLIERLIRLEKRLQSGGKPPAPASSSSGHGSESNRGPNPATGRSSASATSAPSPSSAASTPQEPSAPSETPTTHRSLPRTPVAAPPAATPRPSPAAASTPVVPTPAASKPAAATPAQTVAPSAGVPQSQSVPAAPISDLPPVERWRRILDRLATDDPKTAAFLAHAEVLEVNNQRIRLSYEKGSIASVAFQDPSTQPAVRQIAAELLGAGIELMLNEAPGRATPGDGASKSGPDSAAPQSVFSVDKEQRERAEQAAIAEARNHPAVQEAIRVLGARLKNIELPK